jgi:N,N-dimethylformamidase beta subunit-like protein
LSFLAVLLAALAAGNPIPAENAQQGTTEWAGPDVRGTAIQGYSSEVSVAPGQTIHFHISTQPAEAYHVHVFRLGWYGGLGGRLLACIPAACGQVSHGKAYPTPWGGWAGAGWPVSDELTIPVGWPSGYYVAKFELRTGIQEGNAAFQPFVVRPDTERRSSILVQVPVNTWEAYNPWGGKSLYDSNSTGPRATRVSFERPLPRSYQPTWEWEIQLVRFLEREGYDVSYQTDLDTDRDPASLLAHRAVLVDGHDEYWTVAIRDAFDAALAKGTNLGFFGANIGYWRMQYEDDQATVHIDKGAGDLFRELTPPRPECDLLGVQFEGGQRSSATRPGTTPSSRRPTSGSPAPGSPSYPSSRGPNGTRCRAASPARPSSSTGRERRRTPIPSATRPRPARVSSAPGRCSSAGAWTHGSRRPAACSTRPFLDSSSSPATC